MPTRRRPSRAAKTALLHRDGRKCGIHLGGCGKEIESRTQCEVDHIVPFTLSNKLAPDPRGFDSRWNYQPMHPGCHETKRDRMDGRVLKDLEAAALTGARTPDDWPRFQCQCHFLQIEEGDLYVHTKGAIGAGRHLLCPKVERNFPGNRQDALLVIAQWTGPGEISEVGYSALGKEIRGYILPTYSSKRVPGFNIMEKARVGLPVPKLVHVDELGHITPLSGPTN